MGRYYDGDISGKFWFGIQASDDADFFGVAGSQPEYIEYYFDEGNLEDVKKGVAECLDRLGENKERLDKFFAEHSSYNDEMLVELWNMEYKTEQELTDFDIQTMLRWYARLELGNKILTCLLKNKECSFTAEV